jgi:ubiquinone biosynthesis protein UbiJ
MLQQLSGWIGPLVIERLTLALNHVLASEGQASERLRPHAGRVLQVLPKGVPALLQAPELLAFRITPAGLLEALAADAPGSGDLRIEMDLSNPARLIEAAVSGQRPAVSIQGDARLATDIGWLMDNLRWDYEDDLARLFGPMPAHQIAQAVRLGATALRQGLAALARLVPERPAS